MTKDKDPKLTFFENIYYWLWYMMPKLKQWGDEPAPQICYLFTLLRIFNGIFIFILFNAVFLRPSFFDTTIRENIVKTLLGEYKIILILILGVLALFIASHDEKRYEKKIKLISQKVDKLTPKQKRLRIVIFVVYVIASIGLMFLIPSLEKMYTN